MKQKLFFGMCMVLLVMFSANVVSVGFNIDLDSLNVKIEGKDAGKIEVRRSSSSASELFEYEISGDVVTLTSTKNEKWNVEGITTDQFLIKVRGNVHNSINKDYTADKKTSLLNRVVTATSTRDLKQIFYDYDEKVFDEVVENIKKIGDVKTITDWRTGRKTNFDNAKQLYDEMKARNDLLKTGNPSEANERNKKLLAAIVGSGTSDDKKKEIIESDKETVDAIIQDNSYSDGIKAKIYLIKDDYANARDTFKKTVSDKNTYSGRLMVARIMSQTPELNDASQINSLFTENEKKNEPVIAVLAYSYYEKEDYANTIIYYSKIPSLYDDEKYKLADSYLKTNKYDDAIKLSKKSFSESTGSQEQKNKFVNIIASSYVAQAGDIKNDVLAKRAKLVEAWEFMRDNLESKERAANPNRLIIKAQISEIDEFVGEELNQRRYDLEQELKKPVSELGDKYTRLNLEYAKIQSMLAKKEELETKKKELSDEEAKSGRETTPQKIASLRQSVDSLQNSFDKISLEQQTLQKADKKIENFARRITSLRDAEETLNDGIIVSNEFIIDETKLVAPEDFEAFETKLEEVSEFVDARRVALALNINPSIYKDTKSENALYDAIIAEAGKKFKEYTKDGSSSQISQEDANSLLFLVKGRKHTDKIKEDEQMKALYLLVLKGDDGTLESLGQDLEEGLLDASRFYEDEDMQSSEDVKKTYNLLSLIEARKLNNPEMNKKLEELAEKIGTENLAKLGNYADEVLAYYNERATKIRDADADTLAKINLRCNLKVKNIEEVLCQDIVSNEVYLVPPNQPLLNLDKYALPVNTGDLVSSSIPNFKQALVMHMAGMLKYDETAKIWIVPAIDGKKIVKTDTNGNILKDSKGEPIIIGEFLRIGLGENDFIAANFADEFRIEGEGEKGTYVHPEGYVIRNGKVESSQRFIPSLVSNGDKKKGIVDLDYSLPFGFPVYKDSEGNFYDGRDNSKMTKLSNFVKGDDKFIEKLKTQSVEEQAKLIEKREIWQSFIGSLSRPLSGIQKSFWDKVLLETGYTEFAGNIIAQWMGWTPDKWAVWLCSKFVNEGLPDDVKVDSDRAGNKVITMRLQGSKEQTVDERTLYDISWLIAPAKNDIVYDICFESCENCVHVGDDNEHIVVEKGSSSSGSFVDYVGEDYSSAAICFREKGVEGDDGIEEQSFRQPIVGEGFVPEDVAQIYADQLTGIGNLSAANSSANPQASLQANSSNTTRT